MERFKKYVAEFIGTLVLVFMGCGTAMLVGCNSTVGCGYLLTALAFGLSIVAMAYSIGNISGCHVNPAVSLAVFINGGIDAIDFLGYLIAQLVGAFVGSALLYSVFKLGNVTDVTTALGSNGTTGVNGSDAAAFLVEVILTFIFVMAILGVTSKKASHGSFAGIVIGLTLTFVHIFGIGLTGTSVNPARSIGPAVMCALAENNNVPLSCVWIFICAPFAGAAIAALTFKLLEYKKA